MEIKPFQNKPIKPKICHYKELKKITDDAKKL
jgi:hypothetical protein